MKCIRCEQEKQLGQFPGHYNSSAGVYKTCKACVAKHGIKLSNNIKARERVDVRDFLAKESKEFLLKLDIAIREIY